MQINNISYTSISFPESLKQIPCPPKELFIISDNVADLFARPLVAIVGSRRMTAYGKQVTTTLATELAQAGVVIVSGLAFGVDATAHRSALKAGGLTIAVLPCGLDHIYPASHQQLARDIVQNGGALISEYPVGTQSYPVHFIARNRLISGLSNAVLITEAAQKSGTLHTARYALEQGKDVFAVPGNITNPNSVGTHNLIKMGAGLVTNAQDILFSLGITKPSTEIQQKPRGNSQAEQIVLDLLADGIVEGGQLLAKSKLDVALFNQTITMLEINGTITALGFNTWAIRQ